MIELPERVTIAEAATLAPLLAAAAGSGALRLDGTRVQEIDTAGLQLLVAAARSAGPLEWQGKSEALVQAACLIGVDRALGLGGAQRAQG